MWRFLLFVVVVVGATGGILYFTGIATTAHVVLPDQGPGPRSVVTQELDLGRAPAWPGETPALSTPNVVRDPIIVRGAKLNLCLGGEQEVSTRVAGQLSRIFVEEGARVRPGTVLAQLDEQQARSRYEALRYEAESTAKIEQAETQVKFQETVVRNDMAAMGSVKKEEREMNIARLQSYKAELRKTIEEQEIAKRKLREVQLNLAYHTVVADIAGEVVKVYRKPGSTLREGEPLFHIIQSDRLRAEGLVEAGRAEQLRPGMRVQIEPERAVTPVRVLNSGHTAAITGVALTPDERYLVSVGADGAICLWDWYSGSLIWRGSSGPRESECRGVAMRPGIEPGAGNGRVYTFLVAVADGTAKLIRLRVGATEVTAQTQDWSDGHSERVEAVAFSPNGQFCATGGADRRIAIWKVDDGKLLYHVRADQSERTTAHRGTVTWLAFSPDGALLSAATDKSLKRWRLGDNNAELVAQVGGRTGDVRQLGLSADGLHVLFDHDDKLRVLSAKTLAQVEGVLSSRGYGEFTNLALFSPGGDMVLTSAQHGRLQLLATPCTPATAAFFRTSYALGFRANSLNVLGGLVSHAALPSPGLEESLSALAQVSLWSTLAGKQPEAPTPDITPLPGLAVPLASLVMPSLQVRVPSARSLTAVPELWNLGGGEVAQLVTPEPKEVLCGTFTSSGRICFTAGGDKVVRIWLVPEAESCQRPLEGQITYVGSNVEADGSTAQFRVSAEFDNPIEPTRRLKAGGRVTLIAYPEASGN